MTNIANNKNTTLVIFGGTVEGRLLAEHFAESSAKIHISVATEYGAALLPDAENVHIHSGRMNAEGIECFLRDINPAVCVDATHPYAVDVTKNILTACQRTKVEYMRVCRKIENGVCEGSLDSCVKYVNTVEEAAEFFKNTEGNIFITTGSKELEKYTVIPDYKNRCFARVLPTLSVMKSCHRLGFEGRNLIGMQGPFSEEMNIAMLRQCNASFLVTKQSGQQGGYREKCEAAIREGVSLVIVGVPTGSTEGIELDEAINILDGKINCEADSINQKSQLNQNSNEKNVPEKELEKELGKELGKETENEPQKELQHVSRKIYLIGMGPGNPQNCTYEAEECLKKADVIIGAGRVLDICDSLNKKIAEKPHLAEYKPDKVYEFLTVDEAGKKYQNIAIVFSGDIGYYSGAEKMAEYFLNENKKSKAAYWDIVRISGLSSPLYFLDKIGISWGNVKLLSRHAQQCNVTEMLKKYGKICVLLGKSTDVSDICRELILAGYDTMSVKMSTETHTEYKSKVHEQQGSVKLCVGERLSYKNERIVWGTPSDLIDMEFNPLSVLYISCS